MDLWSDSNLMPLMAATAHWIEVKLENTPQGPQRRLVLRCDLVGFVCVPTRHTGEHLAGAFLYILDRLDITEKVRIFMIKLPFVFALYSI